MKILLIIPTLLISCASTPPACTPEALAAIEVQYMAEVLAACQGYSFEECPARLEIESRYNEIRNEWVRCEPR